MLTLEEKVAGRVKLLGEIVDFTDDLMLQKGNVLKGYIGSSHTNIVRELCDFNSFSFWSDTGHTMFGGNDYKIWYGKGQEKRLVLNLYFQADIKEAKVKAFDTKTDWLNALKRLIKNKARIVAKQEKERKLGEEKAQKQRAQEASNTALREKAIRLGINI